MSWFNRKSEEEDEFAVGYERPPRPPIPMPPPRPQSQPEIYQPKKRTSGEIAMDTFEAAAKDVEQKLEAAEMIHNDMMAAGRELAAKLRQKGREAAGYIEATTSRTAKMMTFMRGMEQMLDKNADVNDNSGATQRELEALAESVNSAHTFETGSVDGLCARCGLDALHPIHLLEPKKEE